MDFSYEIVNVCLSDEDIKERNKILLWYKDKFNYRDFFAAVNIIDNYMHRFREKITNFDILKLAVLFLCDSEGAIDNEDYLCPMFDRVVTLEKEIIKDLRMLFYVETVFHLMVKQSNNLEKVRELCMNYNILRVNPSELLNANLDNVIVPENNFVYLTKLPEDRIFKDTIKKIKEYNNGSRVSKYSHNNDIVAVKTISSYDQYVIEGHNIREISLLLQLKHQNIITTLGYYMKDSVFKIVFEHVDCTLTKAPASIVYIQQLLMAVEYLHENNIIHCDIKPDNIMISNGTLKLIDFGLSFRYYKDIDCRTGLDSTTCFIIPLDVLMGNKYYGYDMDIWGCGVCIYYMLTKKYPFYFYVPHATEHIYMLDIFNVLGSPTEEQWKILSYENSFAHYKFIGFPDIDNKYSSILYKMFNYIGKERPTVKQVLEMLNE
jgi:cyclin-dependent kinase 2